nr:unnamed protein product [Digitaria exilis]
MPAGGASKGEGTQRGETTRGWMESKVEGGGAYHGLSGSMEEAAAAAAAAEEEEAESKRRSACQAAA